MSDQRNPWPVLLVICLGFFMIMLDTTIVYVATPSILSGLHASLDQILWVFNGYLLAYAVLLITAGRLGDLYGPRQLFAIGLVVFTVASALCGLAQDSNQLVAARVLQGIGGALLAPQSLTMLTAIFPPERRGAALGIWGAVVGLSTVAGPTLGGLIVTNWDWRWIFYVNVPVGVLALVGTFLLVPDLRPGRRHRLDLVGVGLASVALFAVVFGLIEGQRYDWGVITGWLTIPMVIAAGLAIFTLFLVWERFQSEPLVPLRLFRDRNFSVMNWTGAAMQFAMQGIFIPLVIYTQSVLGMTALQSGLTVAPMSATAMILSPFAGRLADRFGGKYLAMVGLAIFGAGAATATWVASTTSTQMTFFLPFVLTGLGLGLIFAPMTTIAMRDITPRLAGAASGVLNTTRQLGSAIGAAAVGAVLQNQLAVSFHDRAVADAAQLPPAFRDRFIDGFAQAGRTGFAGSGTPPVCPRPTANLPPQAVSQMQQLVHDVFVNGFVAALRPTVSVALVVLLLASLSCLLVISPRRSAEPAVVEEVAVA